jgi:hypothetical protein
VGATMTVRHPAKFTGSVLTAVTLDMAERGVPRDADVFDPFAGVGLVHALPYLTFGIEIEPEWADRAARTMTGESLASMEETTARYDVVVTSPCYGNRMADHHENKDACKRCSGSGIEQWPDIVCTICGGDGISPRRSYRHDLGRMPTEGSSATLHYGPAYRAFHRRAWRGVYRVLEPGGLFYLNSKDFYRRRRRVRVSDWHRRTCRAIGFEHAGTLPVKVNGLRMGANRERVHQELIYVLRKPL